MIHNFYLLKYIGNPFYSPVVDLHPYPFWFYDTSGRLLVFNTPHSMYQPMYSLYFMFLEILSTTSKILIIIINCAKTDTPTIALNMLSPIYKLSLYSVKYQMSSSWNLSIAAWATFIESKYIAPKFFEKTTELTSSSSLA